MVKTEYSTFTYFITSLSEGKTVTDTDIVVSSNVVTRPPTIAATPVLPAPGSQQVSVRQLRQAETRPSGGLLASDHSGAGEPRARGSWEILYRTQPPIQGYCALYTGLYRARLAYCLTPEY